MAFSSRLVGIGFSCFRGDYGFPIFVFVLLCRLISPPCIGRKWEHGGLAIGRLEFLWLS